MPHQIDSVKVQRFCYNNFFIRSKSANRYTLQEAVKQTEIGTIQS
jgi:hypothetical protein